MFKFCMINLLFKNGWLARELNGSCFFGKRKGFPTAFRAAPNNRAARNGRRL